MASKSEMIEDFSDSDEDLMIEDLSPFEFRQLILSRYNIEAELLPERQHSPKICITINITD